MFPQSQMSQASPDAEATEHVEVNLDAEVEAANPNADFNEAIPPPKAGAYLFRWEVNPDKGVVPSQTKKPPHTPFLNVFLLGKLVLDGSPDDGFTANYYLNSLINRRKGTSEAHHFLNILGSPVPQRITLGNLKTQLETTLANNPLSPAMLEWRCSYKDPQTDKWIEQYKSMSQFPKELDDGGKWTGNYLNVAKSKLDGSDLFAQAYIVELLTDADYKKLSNS